MDEIRGNLLWTMELDEGKDVSLFLSMGIIMEN